MPTPKQVRFYYRQINSAYERLQTALNNAHARGVIKYNKEKFNEESPCHMLWEVDDRIRKTTEKALAQAMREEIMEIK